MKCKIGDLAIVIKPFSGNRNLGKIVEVVAAGHLPGCWLVTSRQPLVIKIDGVDHYRCHGLIDDARLSPIRDPGDDAVDESAAWLPPVPSAAPVASPAAA